MKFILNSIIGLAGFHFVMACFFPKTYRNCKLNAGYYALRLYSTIEIKIKKITKKIIPAPSPKAPLAKYQFISSTLEYEQKEYPVQLNYIVDTVYDWDTLSLLGKKQHNLNIDPKKTLSLSIIDHNAEMFTIDVKAEKLIMNENSYTKIK